MRDVLELIRARQFARSGEGRRVRLAAGLTQAELAEAVGVHPQTVGLWESNSHIPTRQHLARYAEVVARAAEALQQLEEKGDDDENDDG